MSASKNAITGATWIRRGLVAIAGTAMALTSVVAAPSPASAAPPVKDTTITVEGTISVESPVTVNGKKDKDATIVISYSTMGGGWA